MNKEKIKPAIEKTIRYMNGNYYSKLEEKMIVGYLEGALKRRSNKQGNRRKQLAEISCIFSYL